MQLNQCKICNQDIPKRYLESKKKYQTHIVCSRACYRIYSNTPEQKEFYKQNRLNSTGNLGKLRTEEWKMEHSKRLTGRKFSEEARKNIADGHRGEKAYNWKGGVTSVNKNVRSIIQYLEWRKMVQKRDKYTCQICNKKGGKIHVDHIVPLSVFVNSLVEIFGSDLARKLAPESVAIFDIGNGRVLCESCHKQTHTWGSRSWNYKPQHCRLIKML